MTDKVITYLISAIIALVSICVLKNCNSDEASTDVGSSTSVAENKSTHDNDDLGEADSSHNENVKEEVEEESVLDYKDDYLPKLTVSRPEQILHRVGYTTSYNNKTKNANWVAWHLTREHTHGKWSRDGIPYMADDDVKGPRQEVDDWYNYSLPVNHGHMCPAGDCKWEQKAMEQTFLLTNMCPQNNALNAGDWEELESRCRGWARHYGDVYIVCGPIFYSSKYKTIGNNVGVPDAFFKVVLCMKNGIKALGFIYPNNGESHKIQTYVTTVDKVEQTTGIDFFTELPDDVETAVEAEANFNKW